LVLGHYVRNSNQIHRSETRVNAIVSDKKKDAAASSRSGINSVEDKNETIFFSVRLS
jgi:hypothetical protein